MVQNSGVYKITTYCEYVGPAVRSIKTRVKEYIVGSMSNLSNQILQSAHSFYLINHFKVLHV